MLASSALLVGCAFSGLGEPPSQNHRDELIISPPQDEQACPEVGQAGFSAPPFLLAAGERCDREREAFCFALRSELRELAAATDPHASLRASIEAFDRFEQTRSERDLAWARASADLAVSGRRNYLRFASDPPAPDDFMGLTASSDAIRRALERAYRVAWALRGPPSYRAQMRAELGWIAVSPEDDLPDHPVNIASSPFAQTELRVLVRPEGVSPRSVRTRLMIATTDPAPESEVPSDLIGVMPPPVPRWWPEHGPVLIYVHGHTSLAEEGATLAAAMVEAARARGEMLTLISMDHPSNGYAERIDPGLIVDAAGGAEDAILRFLDAFVVSVVDALERERPGTQDRIDAVLGGSLGGNLVLRLGERSDPPAWARRLVAWSPASVDFSWSRARLVATNDNEFSDVIKHEAVRLTRYESEQLEVGGSRARYFADPLMGLRAQASYWYRDGWEPCKQQLIEEGLVQIGETYDERLRRWHYRIAYEQLIFSHVEYDGERRRFESIHRPLLLVTGAADDSAPVATYFFIERLAPHLTMPGRTLFLESTGHALHSERPAFLGREIAEFIARYPGREQ